MNIKTEITKIHYDKNSKNFFLPILEFASVFYNIASSFKNFLYDKKILKPKTVAAFVISVGNITTGGVGKTPVVSEIAKHLINKGKKVAIVSRGYKGKLSNKNINVISDGEKVFYDASMSGDEPYWLAVNTKGAIVITSKNRYEASKYAVEKFGVRYIILDDGFQHRKFKRDLDIVLTDSKSHFGNEKLLPAGPLRENLNAFKRIDKLVVVSKNKDHSEAKNLSDLLYKKYGIPTYICKTEPDIAYNIKTNEILDKTEEATAICAIGQPEKFYEFLSEYNIKQTITFDDHHSYTPDDLPKGAVITTEKDAVKMMNFNRSDIYALKLKTVLDKNLLNEL